MADVLTTQDHPFVVQGRRHARDCIASADRIGREIAMTDRAQVLGTAFQMTASTMILDGEEPMAVYEAISGLLAWAVIRLNPDDQFGVLQSMVNAAVVAVDEKRPV